MNIRLDGLTGSAVAPAVLVLMAALASGCSVHTNANLTSDFSGYTTDVSTVQMVSTLVGGKNVFIPGTVVATGGEPLTLSIYNTTENPHGFAIHGLNVEVVLLPGQETRVDLPAMEGGHVYQIHCHLHPPHRSATLVVLPGH